MPDYTYLPNQAVSEYQARLAGQKAADKAATQYTPGDMVAVYDLKDRLPDWNRLLDIEKPHLYSSAALREGIDVMLAAEKNSALGYFAGVGAGRVSQQIAAFEAAIAERY